MRFHRCNPGSLSLAVVVPTSGPAGVWGATTRACAELAATEINLRGGVLGRELRLQIIDSRDGFERRVASMVAEGEVEGVVAMHTSDLRQTLCSAIAGQVPYVYTPLYEGGEASRGVFCIGETPQQQLPPALHWLREQRAAKRWYLIGNDYVWPHQVHRQFIRHAQSHQLQVLGQALMPLGSRNFDQVLERVKQLRPDGVFVSLVGQDSILFNRAFAKAGLASCSMRLACAMDESLLLGIGSNNTERLYAVGGYFSTVDSSANRSFQERYHQYFGDRSPPLNAFGLSMYEGVHFFAQLHTRIQRRESCWEQGLPVDGVRGAVYTQGGCTPGSIYLAKAHDLRFDIQSIFV